MVEKAVILARGLATRMRRRDSGAAVAPQALRMASSGLKALIPIGGRPFLDYIVASLLAEGLRRICLVIAPDCDVLRDYAAGVSRRSGAEVCWTIQEEPLGTADAVLAAERFVGPDSFVVCNGDNLYPQAALRALSTGEERHCCLVAFERAALVSEGNIAEERAKEFAVAVADRNGNLLKIVEKPLAPEHYVRDGKLWLSMNLYRFTPRVFEACRAVQPHPERGELELTSAVQELVQAGDVPFRVAFCERGVLDLTRPGDIQAVEEILRGRDPGFPAPELWKR